jgi:hypothetical protein
VDASLLVIRNPGRLEIQPVDIWNPPRANQEPVYVHRRFLVIADELNALLAALRGDLPHLSIEVHVDAVSCQRVRQDFRGVAEGDDDLGAQTKAHGVR